MTVPQTSFVVAWDDQRRNQQSFFDQRTGVYAARVSESGTVLDPPGSSFRTDPTPRRAAAILSAPGVSYVASTRFMLTPPFDSTASASA